MENDLIFQPLEFKNLTVKNRIFRSSISGRWDNYDGSGTQARINWEEKFARGGVGAIISSFVPIHVRGRIMPNYAMIDDDDKIPFWRKVAEKVHEYDSKFIMQLSHSGRQRDVPGVENLMNKGLSSTSKMDTFHGLLCQAMTLGEIKQTIQQFVDGARRAREAGLDGVELHASHGYLFTQFLSSGINDRKDEYGGSLENRARFLLDVIHGIRKEVGDDYHLQVKINIVDENNALYPWEKWGNKPEEYVQICKWVEEAGADGLHVSAGSLFPHPLVPPGGFPLDEANWWYGSMASSGVRGYMNYTVFHFKVLRPLFLWLWNRTKKKYPIEGVSAELCKKVKESVNIPVLNTGGYQDGKLIRKVISEGYCDGVAIARPLIANNDLAKILEQGKDLPDKPCSFCNRCLLNAPANPLGCYDLRRYDNDHDAMIREVMTVYDPPPFR
ncbi:NADH:flavin oxidoreductase/NADH oxidase [Nitrosococcus halophilus Nc 4]|uniref:NADH:flavin oxidoreductase/NADH oxidase n=1 Tax=Nitrosococcus halophilus (strain Nc4) TaxID=472759 RepID=D5C0G6_NITHN|nr:NADH:flavin oxidoreductase [Nitrosococcus halophilus]ADE14492.1 NADH:flavin oxidoreductase/NADH oxidase [Nitrosococcus halophilus Nc 4]